MSDQDMGWSWFGQKPEQMTPEQKAAAQEFKDLFTSIFSGKKGKRALQLLRARTIEKPCMPQQAVDGDAMALLMSFRDGENNIVRIIEKLANGG
jgi:hypothetical protein